MENLDRGRALRDEDNDAEAIPILRDAVREHPDSVEAWTLLAESYLALQRYPDALQSSKCASELDPQNLRALAAVSGALVGLKRYPEAIQTCDVMQSLDASAAETLRARGRALGEMGQTDAAIALCDQALAPNPLQPFVLSRKCGYLIQLRRLDEAMIVARSALNMKPTALLPQMTYGMALLSQSKYKDAMRIADEAIAKFPKDPRPWILKGAIFSEQGQMGRSKTAWARRRPEPNG